MICQTQTARTDVVLFSFCLVNVCTVWVFDERKSLTKKDQNLDEWIVDIDFSVPIEINRSYWMPLSTTIPLRRT